MSEDQKPPYISYGRIGRLEFCPFSYFLEYEKGFKFEGNVYTAAGKATHSCAEDYAKDLEPDFWAYFVQNLRDLGPKAKKQLTEKKNRKKNKDLIKDWKAKGQALAKEAWLFVQKEFPDYDIFSIEGELFHPLEFKSDKDWHFNGIVDLVLKHKTKDHYIVLDYKTCSWGWKVEKKTDRVVTNQLAYYKHFICKKYNLNPKNVDTYFLLIKSNNLVVDKDGSVKPKMNQKAGKPYEVCEKIKTSSGTIKTNRALKVLNSSLQMMDKGFYPKNIKNCKKCDHYFDGTCPRSLKKKD